MLHSTFAVQHGPGLKSDHICLISFIDHGLDQVILRICVFLGIPALIAVRNLILIKKSHHFILAAGCFLIAAGCNIEEGLVFQHVKDRNVPLA